ncbi:uracil-DNA glycosylase [Stomatohabitans albus]|uniref:uracil-DNA glycosylase n=1 Tax=Stomatohabitans albus TaxID=3110766 RepID=UPI00300C1A6A
MGRTPVDHLVGPGWDVALEPVADALATVSTKLHEEVAQGNTFLPKGNQIFAAFQIPFDTVKVLIVGQDPYPTPGHPIGLSFATDPSVSPLPKSLQNIFKEYHDDLGYPIPATGDLTPWVQEGVMLLNRVLTVRPGQPGSHRHLGWQTVTDQVISALGMRAQPLVAMLWGNDAKTARQWLPKAVTIESVHPSPLSAHRGFFGSQPFSRANEALERLGATPINWRLP